MLYAILLILLGVVAAASLIVAKRPDAQKYLNMLAPYQGSAGLVFVGWGVWMLILVLTTYINNIGASMWGTIFWISFFVTALLQIALGFILGYGLINTQLAKKNEVAAEKSAAIFAKLAPLQGKLGILAIICGIWFLIARIAGLFWVVIY